MGKQTLKQRGWQHPRCVRRVVVNRPSVTGAWRSWPSRCWTALGERDATTIAATKQRAAQAHNNKPENDSTRAADIR
jgi:hypothetical protein